MHSTLNKPRLTFISYLSNFFLGSLISTLGMVISPISQAFSKSPDQMGQLFTLMNIGIFAPMLFSGFLFKRFGLGTLLKAAACLSLLACITLFFFPSLMLFAVTIALLGATAGIFMNIGSFLTVHIHEEAKERSSQLLRNDFFFSLARMLLSLTLGFAFERGASWLYMYLIMGSLSALMLALCFDLQFPQLAKTTPTAQDHSVTASEPWGVAVWLLSFALFAFLFAEPTFCMWLPSWLQQKFSMQAQQAGFYITVYWSVKALGLFINQYLVRHVKLHVFLLTLSACALISAGVAANSDNATVVLIFVAAAGFFNAGMFSGILSYGSLQTRLASPTLTSTLLMMGTIGTMVFSSVSSYVYSNFGLHWALNTATVVYAALFIALILAYLTSKFETSEIKLSQANIAS